MQDEWRAEPNVTLSLGVRYDLRPGFDDREGNISNFLRDTPNGDVVVPDEGSLGLTSPGFAGSIGNVADPDGRPGRPAPVAAAHRQEQRRASTRHRVAAGGDNRTVMRAGYGIYHTRMLGAVFNSLTGIHTSDNVTFPNASTPAARTYASSGRTRLPATRAAASPRVGTQNFSTANDPNYKDPLTQQWSLTFERELNRPQRVPRHLLRLPQHAT